MKQTVHLIVVFTSVFLLFTSCSTHNNNSKTDREGRVYDSIFDSKQQELNSFFQKINWVSDLEDIKLERKTMDTLIDQNRYQNNITAVKTIHLDSLEITLENSIIVNNTSNLTFPDINNNEIMKNLKTNFFLSIFSGETTYHDIPTYWFYYNDKNFLNTWQDSINSNRKKRILSNQSRTVDNLKGIKYVVVLFDKALHTPQIISDEYFSPGLLTSSINLYELDTKKLLKTVDIQSVNSDKIMHRFSSLPDNIKSLGINALMIENLCKVRNRQLLSYIYDIQNL